MKRWILVLLCVLSTGFQYASLPGDNLIENPWFMEDCKFSLTGWNHNVTTDGLHWDQSDKTQDPIDINCGGEYVGTAVRWARQSGKNPEFSPNQDALLWQIVGPVDPSQTRLRFHFLFVAHRMTKLRAQISGGASPEGPWTVVWTPMDKGWLFQDGPNAPFNGTCSATDPKNRDCLWDKVTEAELGSLDPLVHDVSTGYPYYRIEFLGNYPTPDSTTTGDVGAKVVRVYFALGEGTGEPGSGPDDKPDPGDDPSSEDSDADQSAGCASTTSMAWSMVMIIGLCAAWMHGRRRVGSKTPVK